MNLAFDTDLPPVLFRRFETQAYLDDFLAGRIFITTLQWCRMTEDTARADGGEGTYEWRLNELHAPVVDHETSAQLMKVGIDIPSGGAKGLTVRNARRSVTVPDARVLCMTEALNPNTNHMGRYAAVVTKPREFSEVVSRTLLRFAPALREGALARVVYAPRLSELPSSGDTHPALIKPLRYAAEEEWRLLWLPSEASAELDRTTFSCPEAVKFIRRIPL